MSLTLPQPAGLLRSRLSRALALIVPEADRDEAIVAIVRSLEDVGIPIQGSGWLDDDEPLARAFRQEGLDSDGMPLDEPNDDNELFLDATEVGDLPSDWDDAS